MITMGIVDEDLESLMTTGNCFRQLWVSKHGLKGKIWKSRTGSSITSTVLFTWFEIKCDPCIIFGPYHKLKEVLLVREMKGSDQAS